MAEKLKRGDAVTLRLSKKHTLEGDLVEHAAKFVRYHPDGEWADVELEQHHSIDAGRKVHVLSLPTAQLTAALLLLFLFAVPVRAQFLGYTSPQSVSQTVFSGQTTAAVTPNSSVFNCVASNGSPCAIPNLGQTVHFLSFTAGGGGISELVLRLEGSNDGTNFFQISDDVGNLTGGTTVSGAVFAVGFYPVVRARIVVLTSSGGSVTVQYAGASSTPVVSTGIYNPAQQSLKTIFAVLSAGSNQNGTVNAPFASSGGYILLKASGAIPIGSTLTITAISGPLSTQVLFLALTTATVQVLPVPSAPGTVVTVNYTSGGASAQTLSLYYEFSPPGSATSSTAANVQPLSLTTSAAQSSINSEQTGTNAILTKTITGNTGTRAHLWSVSGRCSAGTAGLTVTDAGAPIWSSGAAEVGTTTFKFQWNPGLASGSGNTMVITLTACGAANVGTLDVQASQF